MICLYQRVKHSLLPDFGTVYMYLLILQITILYIHSFRSALINSNIVIVIYAEIFCIAVFEDLCIVQML